MSETNPTKFISFGSQRVNDKSSKECKRAIRINVVLPESTEDKYPEINYKDELAAAKKKFGREHPNGLNSFNDDDDEDVRRIAAEMEQKYGKSVTKKKKWRKDDFADIGMGYDETDSFIDNTDGYDEIIPKNVTTLHGGFYINCGALEFKTDENVSSEDSSSSEDDGNVTEQAASRKRVIESSAESEDDAQGENGEKIKQLEKKPKLINNTIGIQKAIKKRLFSHDKIKQQMRKKRTDETKKTVRELLKERRLDLNMTPLTETDSPEKAEPLPSPKENKNVVVSASVDDIIESVISCSIKKKDEPMDESSKDSTSSKDAGNNKSRVNSSEADSNDDLPFKPVEIVQLPENLPADIITIIDSIKTTAAKSTEGKVKFFTDNVNVMLLNLERKCKCLGKQSRMKVYEHLAPFVKCRKETLIKRAKNLCINDEQQKIKILLESLKTAIGLVMPVLIESYENECRSVVQKKFSGSSEEAIKNLRMPKRHFTWTEEMKKLLRDIITLRKKCYLNEGKQKDSLDKHLIEFIKTEIQVIWPEGWMSMSTLLKCCNIMLPVKKPITEMPKKVTALPSEINVNQNNVSITPSSSIFLSTTPSIPISANSALTITPVLNSAPPILVNTHKQTSGEIKTKPKPITINETVISKVSGDTSNVSKPIKTLPPVEILKTTPPDVNNLKLITNTTNNNNKSIPIIKEDVKTIIIEESPLKNEEPENLSLHVNTKMEVMETPVKEKTSLNHCQIIDLTDQPELKKKPGPKSKTKHLYEYPDKPIKHKKEHGEQLIRVKPKEELTGSSALNQIIADSLSDLNRYAHNSTISKNLSGSVINSTGTVLNSSDSSLKKSYDYSKAKYTSEGDDIQKVMEGLKVLQKMSSPIKSVEETKTSSPVSVIAFNKSYSQELPSMSHTTPIVTHRNNSFQDAFQKHFIPDYNNFIKSSQVASSSSKGSYNSMSKHNHSSAKSSSTTSERYLQNSNNNYAQQNSSKLKSSYSSHQSGSYDMLDDMFTNFLNEYGHSNTANSKSGTSHK